MISLKVSVKYFLMFLSLMFLMFLSINSPWILKFKWATMGLKIKKL